MPDKILFYDFHRKRQLILKTKQNISTLLNSLITDFDLTPNPIFPAQYISDEKGKKTNDNCTKFKYMFNAPTNATPI